MNIAVVWYVSHVHASTSQTAAILKICCVLHHYCEFRGDRRSCSVSEIWRYI